MAACRIISLSDRPWRTLARGVFREGGTGAGYGLRLTCAVFEPGRMQPLKLIQVPSAPPCVWVDDPDESLFSRDSAPVAAE
jgi:hypothetical protein